MQLRSGPRHLVRVLDVFQLYFTAEVITRIYGNTNKYTWSMILEKQTYSEADGSWKEVTPTEMMIFRRSSVNGSCGAAACTPLLEHVKLVFWSDSTENNVRKTFLGTVRDAAPIRPRHRCTKHQDKIGQNFVVAAAYQ